jgi:LmbE family N-acetylglucosaminyl deacetylase
MPPHFYVPERALAIYAHCDDIEFGISGTIARWTAAGSQITYCIVTDSGSGDNRPDADLDELRRVRREEQLASAKIVGVEDVRFLDYADGTLEPTMELRRDLTRLIRDIRPTAVVTFDPETILTRGRMYVNHPDHRATGVAATYAVFPSAGSRPIFPELLTEGYEPWNVDRLYLNLSNQPDHFIDISETMHLKLEALRCHMSQFGDQVDNVLERVRGWNAENGKMLGTAYAETFRLMLFKEGVSEDTEGGEDSNAGED